MAIEQQLYKSCITRGNTVGLSYYCAGCIHYMQGYVSIKVCVFSAHRSPKKWL